jgi:hypothetical protein
MMQIKRDLSRKAYPGSVSADIKKNIPRWHECSFTSPSGRVSYTLTIALSLSEPDKMMFEYRYLIVLYPGKSDHDPEKVMLCPHINADLWLGDEIEPGTMDCGNCHFTASVSCSDDLTRYDVQFTRSFGVYKDNCSSSEDRFTDYYWLRYVLCCLCWKEVMIRI